MRLLAILSLILLAAPSVAEPVDRVILVSVDGLRADLLRDLLDNDVSGDYANFQRLLDEGCTTFNARTDYTHTVTLPNHTCMVTGRPVLQPDGQPATVHHGYTSNSDPGPTDTLHNAGNPAVAYIASAFDVAHDHGLTTALYASKSKFVIFDQSYDATHGAPDVTGPDNGRDKIDVFLTASGGFPSNAAAMQAAFMADLASAPAQFSFVHYRDPDSAGHAYGWGSAVWNTAVRAVDGYLGEVLDFVAANPALMGRTVVIVTADHGGSGTGHSVATDPRMYTIPFFVWGADVAAAADLYALNPTRLDPGAGRPDYNAAAPVRNGDSGNLALKLLGLPAIVGSTIGVAQDLVVGTPASGVPGTGESAPIALSVFPNPFNGRVLLAYEVERRGTLNLTIHDVSGRLVRHLVGGDVSQGRHQVFWDGRDDFGSALASGMYLVRVASGSTYLTSKLSYVR